MADLRIVNNKVALIDAPDEVIQLFSTPVQFRTQGSITYLDILRIGDKTV